jgi:hypothetical protein
LLRQEAVDRVLQLTSVTMAPRGDGLPGGISHNLTGRCSKPWSLIPVDDLGPVEDIYNGLEFHQPWTRNSLDPISWGGGDAQVSQQSLKPTGGDCSLRPEGLHLLSVSVQLLALCVTQGRVLLIVLVFIIDIVVLLLLLLLLSRCALGCWAPKYH